MHINISVLRLCSVLFGEQCFILDIPGARNGINTNKYTACGLIVQPSLSGSLPLACLSAVIQTHCHNTTLQCFGGQENYIH